VSGGVRSARHTYSSSSLSRSAPMRARQMAPLGAGALLVLGMNLLVDLGSVHRNGLGRLDAQANLLAIVRQHRDLDVIADHDALPALSRQDQHKPRLPRLSDQVRPTRTPGPRHRSHDRHTDTPVCAVIIFRSLAPESRSGAAKFICARSQRSLDSEPVITLPRNPVMPLPSKSRPALWLVVSLVFAVSLVLAGLLFAVGARAQGTNSPESTMGAPAAEAAPESNVPPEQTTPPTGEQASSTGEQAPTATEQTPPAEESEVAVEQPQPSDEHEQSPSATEEFVSPAEQTPPVAEDPPPSSEPTPPAAEDPPPTSEPTPPAAEQPPPTGGEAPPGAEAPPAHEQQTTEPQAGEAGGEASSEERATEGTGDSQTPAGASGSDHKEPANEVVPTSSPATASDTVAMPVISIAAEASQTPIAGESSASSARQQARQVSRELAAFGASILATGSVRRWLDTLGTSSVSTNDASRAAMFATGVLARGRDGGSAIQGHTSGPGPGPSPAPGGAGGGSAAGAGSGVASSASFMLTDTLLQAAPNAMLRLCLSQPSWHTSFFALIPERPG
jgi:hypothetical protein